MVDCKKFFFPDGTPKGMKQVLGERGLNVSKMETEDTREKLQSIHDFDMRKLK